MGAVSCVWVYMTPYFKDSKNDFPFYYYLICLLINACHSIFAYSMYVAVICFFARISDKKIGGTYMTFLNTLSNIGCGLCYHFAMRVNQDFIFMFIDF